MFAGLVQADYQTVALQRGVLAPSCRQLRAVATAFWIIRAGAGCIPDSSISAVLQAA